MKNHFLKLSPEEFRPVPDNIKQKIDPFLSTYRIYDLNIKEIYKSLTHSEIEEVSLAVFDTTINLVLIPNEIRSFDYKTFVNGKEQSGENEIHTYEGFVKNTNHEVRITIYENGLRGYIQLLDKKLYVDQLSRFDIKSKEKDLSIFYFEDALIDGNKNYCGVTSEQEKEFIARFDSNPNKGRLQSADCKIVKIATDADYEFYQRYGTNVNNEILSIINMVAGVYSSTFNLILKVTFQNVWTVSADPYTGDPTTEYGSEVLVNELRNYWQTNFSFVDRNLVHLFTGKGYNLPGVAGRVYAIGTVCNAPDKSYGFTRDRVDSFTTTAHEIGHNFGGVHGDGQNCGTFSASIMCSGIKSIPMYFSSSSVNRISTFLYANGFCLVNPAFFYGISGPQIHCATSVYSIAGLPASAVVSWTVSSVGVVTLTPNGHAVTVTRVVDGEVKIKATISNACINSFSLEKELIIQGGVPSLNGYSIERNGPTCISANYQPISFGIVLNGTKGCDLWDRGVQKVEWQFFNYGPAPHQLTNNAGYYSCNSTNKVINPGIVLGFGSFTSPFMITFRFRIQNRCGLWSDWSPGFSFQITRC